MTIEHWKKHILESIDTIGFENCHYYQNDDLLKFAYNRFMSEKEWQVEREGMKKALNDWLSGLALNVAFYNHDILRLGKEWGELYENANEAREDIFLDHWFDNLTGVLIAMWKERGLI